MAAEQHTYEGYPEASQEIEADGGLAAGARPCAAVPHHLDCQAHLGMKMRLEEADSAEHCDSRERKQEGQVSVHGSETVRHRAGLVQHKDFDLAVTSGLAVVAAVVVDCRGFGEPRAVEDC